MRYPAQHKAKTHERLLKKASQEIRRRGVQGTGIASLMAKLGMTHGGFYAHFDSKNALVAQATVSMFEEHANIVLGLRSMPTLCWLRRKQRLRASESAPSSIST